MSDYICKQTLLMTGVTDGSHQINGRCGSGGQGGWVEDGILRKFEERIRVRKQRGWDRTGRSDESENKGE